MFEHGLQPLLHGLHRSCASADRRGRPAALCEERNERQDRRPSAVRAQSRDAPESARGVLALDLRSEEMRSISGGGGACRTIFTGCSGRAAAAAAGFGRAAGTAGDRTGDFGAAEAAANGSMLIAEPAQRAGK